jgi:hypothetical protein
MSECYFGAVILEEVADDRRSTAHTFLPCHFVVPKAHSALAGEAVAEKSCGASRIHSHVILEALAEEVRGSTFFTTFLPLPCGQRFLHALRLVRHCVPSIRRNDKVGERLE